MQSEFEKYGAVTDVYNTGKGYAFVTFSRKEEASSATQVSHAFLLDMVLTNTTHDDPTNALVSLVP